MESKSFSIIIAAHNEERNIGQVLLELKNFLSDKNYTHEIIVVDDASSDRTGEILKDITGIKIITNPYNKGYGAALKTGARAAKHDYLIFFDGDGQHRPEYFDELIKYVPENDMVVGSRTGYKGPAIRQPGKKLLTWVANYLVEKKIPDINSGFRIIKKDLFLKYTHILPNSFSASTTITLALFKEGLNVKYIPITINKRRESSSTVRPKHALTTALLILRVIMLFNPFKVIMPLAFIVFIISLILAASDIYLQGHLSLSTGIIFLASVLIFILGLLADQISAIRRNIQ